MSVIEIRGLDHVVIRVRDIDAALAFYCDALGCREERRIESLGLIQLRAGASLIDVVGVETPLGRAGGGMPDPKARNVDHFALELASFDETAIRAELESRGIDVGEVGDRYGAKGTGPSLYLNDPDGNVVELKGPATQPPLSASAEG